jgi:hypothetical protein
VDAILGKTAASGYRLRDIVHAIIGSDLFQHK